MKELIIYTLVAAFGAIAAPLSFTRVLPIEQRERHQGLWVLFFTVAGAAFTVLVLKGAIALSRIS